MTKETRELDLGEISVDLRMDCSVLDEISALISTAIADGFLAKNPTISRDDLGNGMRNVKITVEVTA